MGVEHTPEAMERIRRSTYKQAAKRGLAKARSILAAKTRAKHAEFTCPTCGDFIDYFCHPTTDCANQQGDT